MKLPSKAYLGGIALFVPPTLCAILLGIGHHDWRALPVALIVMPVMARLQDWTRGRYPFQWWVWISGGGLLAASDAVGLAALYLEYEHRFDYVPVLYEWLSVVLLVGGVAGTLLSGRKKRAA